MNSRRLISLPTLRHTIDSTHTRRCPPGAARGHEHRPCYTSPMAVIHKCDTCKRAITADRSLVDVGNYAERFELCDTCAAPIRAILKKYKLLQTI